MHIIHRRPQFALFDPHTRSGERKLKTKIESPLAYQSSNVFEDTDGYKMSEAGNQRKPIKRIIIVAALWAVGYLCMRTLRFTYDGLNLLFTCTFFLIPFFALRPGLQLHRWPRVVTMIFLTPFLALSLLCLLMTATCDGTALIEHREMARELGAVRQGRYSVHLKSQRKAASEIK
jgi:hypothetical protein